MRHGSLFSGIGGFDLAAEWMGWDNVFHCEWMPFPRKILSHYWPEAISYHDITTTDFRQHAEQIDILTGGFSCQPYSAAGKRKGKDDDRHLWPHMLRCIREVKPRWVVGENVFGLATWNGGWYSKRCALTLKLKVTPFSRLFFQLQPSTLRTEETEFGLLPTPRTADVEGGTVKNVQTDGKGYFRTNTHGVRWGVKLRDVVESRMLPTPRAFAYKDSATDRGKSNLGEVTGAGSQLNPRFVAEMMGFPPNWTELPFQSGEPNRSKDMETP